MYFKRSLWVSDKVELIALFEHARPRLGQDVKVTVVGSMRRQAANLSVERPLASFTSRSCESCVTRELDALGTPPPGTGRYRSEISRRAPLSCKS